MINVFTSLLMALGQLADGRVLRVLFKSLVVTLAVFIAAAWAGWAMIGWLMGLAGFSATLFAGAGTMRDAAAALLAIGALWLVWRIVAMAVIGFFADEVVQAVETRHYPAAARRARELTTQQQMSVSLRAAGRALLVNLAAAPIALALLFTGIGPALIFWAVNAALLGRELQDMVWLRHQQGAPDAQSLGPHSLDGLRQAPLSPAERFLLGGAIAALLAFPLINLLGPVLGAAGAAHLVHRKDKS